MVVNCAGEGRRLGLGKTKALVSVLDEPLISWHLRMLRDVDDVVVVVGHQAEDVISVVSEARRDVAFAINHEYATTGTAASLALGCRGARGDVISLDGDLLVHPEDFRRLLDAAGPCLGVAPPNTTDAVLTTVEQRDGVRSATAFSREGEGLEWTGLLRFPGQAIEQAQARPRRARPRLRDAHPAPADPGAGRARPRDRHARRLRPRARVDRPDRAPLGMSSDTDTIREFWLGRTTVEGPQAARFHSRHDPYDLEAIAGLCGPGSRVLDLGCGTCVIANLMVQELGCAVHAVDYVPDFLGNALDHPRLTTEVGDARTYAASERYDAILSLGVITYLETAAERTGMYERCASMLAPGSPLLLKAQFGVEEPVDGRDLVRGPRRALPRRLPAAGRGGRAAGGVVRGRGARSVPGRAVALGEHPLPPSRGSQAPVSAPLASILLVVRDEAPLLFRCLSALAKLPDEPAFEVIVVDDGSLDETAAVLAGVEGDLRALRNERPLGYGPACDQAAALAARRAPGPAAPGCGPRRRLARAADRAARRASPRPTRHARARSTSRAATTARPSGPAWPCAAPPTSASAASLGRPVPAVPRRRR